MKQNPAKLHFLSCKTMIIGVKCCVANCGKCASNLESCFFANNFTIFHDYCKSVIIIIKLEGMHHHCHPNHSPR